MQVVCVENVQVTFYARLLIYRIDSSNLLLIGILLTSYFGSGIFVLFLYDQFSGYNAGHAI